MDVTAVVRGGLLPQLREKLADVEARLGRMVTFNEDGALPGMASAQTSPDGTIRLSRGAVQNASVIGEEIMHLHRWTSGFPVLQPGATAQRGRYARGLTQLAGAARRIPRELWRIVQRKLKLLDGAARLDDLTIPAGNRLERLKGQRAERHSLRVNDQYRVTFRWESGHAYEVCVEDYH